MSKDANGRSGGLIVTWRKESFVLSSEFQGSNYLGFEGLWGTNQLRVTIVNIYAPCELRGKRLLCEETVNLMEVRGW